MIKQIAEELALLGYRQKTNPPAGMNQRADRNFPLPYRSGCAPTASPARTTYIAMCETGSLQSPAPVLPPMAHNCSV